jgi:hypothetical protein
VGGDALHASAAQGGGSRMPATAAAGVGVSASAAPQPRGQHRAPPRRTPGALRRKRRPAAPATPRHTHARLCRPHGDPHTCDRGWRTKHLSCSLLSRRTHLHCRMDVVGEGRRTLRQLVADARHVRRASGRCCGCGRVSHLCVECVVVVRRQRVCVGVCGWRGVSGGEWGARAAVGSLTPAPTTLTRKRRVTGAGKAWG